MSGLKNLFGGLQNTTPDYTGLQLQTAVNTLPVPVVWGMSKLSPNVIWYANFQSHQGGVGGGGKGGLFGGGQNTTYSADVILALAEGPVTAINQIWRGQSLYTLAQLGLSFFAGTTPQAVWGYLAAHYAAQALAYQGTAYVAAANYQLTTSATLDNHNFEVMGFRYGSGYGQTNFNNYGLPRLQGPNPPTGYFDADPALVVNDYLTNPQFGVGFPSSSIDATTLFTQSGTDAAYQTYCRAVGLALSPALTSQETASSILARWLQLTNTAAVWSAGLLRFIPYGDGVVTGNGVTFSPNLAPIYDLGDDDYIVESGADPLQVSRSDIYEAYNIWRLECADRSNQYALTTFEARDQNAIELVAELTGARGERLAPTVTAHEICDPGVAQIAGQLMLQRAVYIRNTYKFRVSFENCLLDPMDLVTVTDSALGLSKAPIRITGIDEDENGYLEVTAEEFPLGVASATLYPTASSSGGSINRNVAAEPVNVPTIFEPPASLVGATPQIWIAASGGSAGIADPNWGGANVFLSLDNATYSYVGSLFGSAKQGVLTANVGAFGGTNPDTANTLAVDLTESGGGLSSVSASSAALGVTLCIVDSELLSFQNATLTAAFKYALSNLYRGLYGTSAAAHSAGAQFARLDNAAFKYDLPPQYVGVPLFIKLQSFNSFGGGVQDLSTCTVYTYVPSGVADDHPVARAWATGAPMDMGLVADAVVSRDDYGTPFSLTIEINDDLGAA